MIVDNQNKNEDFEVVKLKRSKLEQNRKLMAEDVCSKE